MSKYKLSPMMRHYKELKEKYPDTILLYRLGDFYEMFLRTPLKAQNPGLDPTDRDCGLEKGAYVWRSYHAVDNYIARLINAGKSSGL